MKVTIVKSENEPETAELIAAHIIEVANAFAKLKTSKLNERVIHLLIKDLCPNVNISYIKDVLNAAARLKEAFIKK